MTAYLRPIIRLPWTGLTALFTDETYLLVKFAKIQVIKYCINRI